MRLSHQNHPRSLETHTSRLSVGSPRWWKPLTGDTGPLLGSTPKPPNRLRSYPLPRPRISLTALRNQLLRN